MDAPRLDKGKYSVLSAELNTGIVLTTDNARFLGKGEVYWEFESLESAERFISESLISNPEIEYLLFDYEGKFVFIETKNGRRSK